MHPAPATIAYLSEWAEGPGLQQIEPSLITNRRRLFAFTELTGERTEEPT